MGVIIPDADFAEVDIIRELEVVRENLQNKNENKDNEQDIDDMVVVTELGKKIPVSLTWLDQEDVILNQPRSNSKKKNKKSGVKIYRPTTRSQKKSDLECGNSAQPPGRVTRARKQKDCSK